MPKKTKTQVIKQATKKVQDNPYLKNFLKEYEEETGLKTRFTAFVAERLDGLEKTSFEQAAKPGNITERIFQLKAHDPAKYRDRVNQQNTQVNVVVSGTSPKDRASVLKKMKLS